MGHDPGILHELRHTAQCVGTYASVDQQAYPLARWLRAEALFQPGCQWCTGKALYCLQARDRGEALALRILGAQKEPGVSRTIQALERSPACRLWPAGLVPGLARIGLYIGRLQERCGVAERGFDTLPCARPEALQEPQAKTKSSQQARTIVINGKRLASRAVSGTTYTGLHPSDRLGVWLVARSVLPCTAVAKGADR